MLHAFWEGAMEWLAALDLSLESLAFLFMIAILAGWVDSIGGGGGLITLPALLWAGVPPLPALATNKLQGTLGTLTSTLNYARLGLINPKQHWFSVLCAFVGSALGTLLVQQFDTTFLATLIPALMIAFALYFMFSPKISDQDQQQRISIPLFALTAGFGVGFYDGFFGPGTGTFYTIAFVMLLGYGLPKATGHTKLLNLTANFAALVFFAWGGHVIWLLGAIMGVGQIVGSFIGSNMASKHGMKLIRPVLVVMSLGMSLKLLLE